MEDRLGQYKIVRQIGKGGMGIIYKAINPATQKPVAIKVLPPVMVDRVTVERFHREVQAMIKLKHPNMIEVYESGMQEGKHFLVMEFLEGENLKNVINTKGPLAIEDVVAVTLEVADALRYMHQLGMIHRDIKPANIMITPDGRVKLMDYGLVKIAGMTSVTVEGTSLGTAEYMSLEQMMGEQVDSRTDIYSLGMTMYEMVTGRLAFTADTFQELLQKHRTQVPLAVRQLRPQVPAQLESIISRAMAKDIKDRYSRVEELEADLQDLMKRFPKSIISPAKNFNNVSLDATQGNNPKPAQSLSVPKKCQGVFPKTRRVSYGKVFILIFLVSLGFVCRDKVNRFFKEIQGKSFSMPIGRKDMVQETNAQLFRLEQAEAYFTQGQIYARQGLFDQAVEQFRSALRLRGDQPGYFKELALVYERKNDYKKAIKAWKDLLKYETSSEEVKIAQDHIKQLFEKLR